MFLKPLKIKSQTAIKGSDRKKLRAELEVQFPSLPSDQWTDLVPNKEEMSIMKIYSHSGESVVVYVLHKNPIFFEVNRCLFPTVYTLWKNPDIVPVFTTWPPVFEKISGGADLMLPGIVVKGDVTPRSLWSLEKGAICAINLAGNRCPVAIGRAALSSSDMVDSGMRGKGVIVIHSYLDHLWAAGDKGQLPIVHDGLAPSENFEENGEAEEMSEENSETFGEKPESAGIINTDNSLSDLTENQLSIEKSYCAAGERDDNGLNSGVENSNNRETEDVTVEESNIECQEETISPEDMDDLLDMCFMCALKTQVKKSDLPLLTSKFFRSYMVPFCPSGRFLDIKKSSHKKLSKFLQVKQSQGLIDVKELSKGVESIVTIHKDNQSLREFSVPEGFTFHEEVQDEETSGAKASYQPPEITLMYSIPHNMVILFKPSGYMKDGVLVASEVREALVKYVKENDLQDKDNKGQVVLDPILTDCLVSKNDYVTHLRWEDLTSSCLSKLQVVHQITFPGQKPVIKKGKIQLIKINVVQRAGNKKVTLLENLETYGIDPHEFAHTVQIGVACSTTVSPLPGKNKGMQILVQGNQVAHVGKLLTEKYQIPQKFVSGLEKAPKSGKKKR
ncbi:eukaryotic translation initiation factor 2D-like [Lingula anatina]|uniref:Eukaryotic translation initiation factor 2D-like n=1 Tax=Lingula anatina TaxID=7574 RepID=A0A1S3IUC9_LINAN|nr:eukaryotic translation initiation factor 2D-like [Lingula anatina]|eukprot:XP_013401541.1 eukaryotic translation initiation factor 2D-like [Lingula anatina]